MTQYREPQGSTAEGFELHGERARLRDLARDVWRSRELLAVLARKEFFVRYRRTSFGALWAVGLPLVQALVLALVLSRFIRFRTEVAYPVFVFSGMCVWSFFSTTVSTAATSIVDGSGLSTKVYFPRALFPLVTVGSGAYGLVLSVGLLLVWALAAGADLWPRVLLLPVALAYVVLFTAALSLLLAALHVYFRDVRYLLQALLLPWFYLTPVFYPLVPAGYARAWIEANPTTGVVELFRAATVGADPGWTRSLWWSLGWCAVILVLAVRVHAHRDRIFADLL